jgi:hypothetical protein
MRRLIAAVIASAAAVALPVLAAAPGVAVGPPSPQAGLVLHYAMEALPAGSVPDDSASALDGRLVTAGTAPRLAPSLRGYGNALELTGTLHQYVDVPRSPILDVDRFTLSAWVRYTGVQNDKTLGRWEVLEKAGAYWMNVRTNGLVRVGAFFGGCSDASWQFLDSTRAVPVSAWRHLAATYDGTWLRIYIDGVAAGAKQVTGRTCASAEPLAVGAKTNPTKGLFEAFWDGRLDDVRIYNHALGLTAVRQLAARP